MNIFKFRPKSIVKEKLKRRDVLLFKGAASKRKSSRSIVKRYFRLIR